KSEVVASYLRKKGIEHAVLNAKQHEKEAFFVSQAGRKGRVTISTNMAGRGTDIILGGNAEFMARAEVDPENAGKPGHELAPEKQASYDEAYKRFKAQCDAEKAEVLAAGGLHILGTERHESRRIDNQLRGRAGRQGDPGSSRFYLSLEDDLMRIFGAERITGLMERLGMEEDVPIEHGLINRAIENAQKKVEGHNFDIRKNLLEYDDVMNQQRKTIYALRRQVLEGRYAPEPTAEEKERGITKTDQPLPTESGKHTVASLAAMLRPILARMCDALSESRVADPNAPGGFTVTTVPINPVHLRSLIYREWGAYPDTKGIAENRTSTLDRLAGDVGSSMIQQRERLLDLSEEMIQLVIEEHCPPNSHADEWDLEALSAAVKQRFNFEPAFDEQGGIERETLAETLWAEVEKVIEARETEYPLPVVLHYARLFYLEEIDERWIEHLKAMEALREGIHLRGYGQKDPKQEYKKEGFVIFGEMMNNIGRNVCEKLFHMQLQRADAPAPGPSSAPPSSKPPSSLPPAAAPKPRKTIESGGGAEAQAQTANGGGNGAGEAKPIRRNEPKVGRNDPCPCGSGKKYKKCHGAVVTT
ncbi:MAG TPA: SEC-C metal-binding domain-containing protein, partial [Polyangia bacterium]